MKTWFSFGAAVALLALSSSLWAYPALTGPTGGATQPDAVTVARGVVDVAADYVNNGNAEVGDTGTLRVLYGIADKTEIGLSYSMQDVDSDNDGYEYDAAQTTNGYTFNNWGVNAKRTMTLTQRIQLALGLIYQDYHDLPMDASLHFTQLYAVASSQLRAGTGSMPAINGSIGVNHTMATFNIEGHNIVDDDALRAFAGVSATFDSGLNITGEYQLKDSAFDAKPLSSVVARYPISPRVNAQLGFSNSEFGFLGGTQHHLFVGLNMNFGGQQ